MAENKTTATTAAGEGGSPPNLGEDAPQRSFRPAVGAGEADGVSSRDRQRQRVIDERAGKKSSARDALENRRGLEGLKVSFKRQLEDLQAEAKDVGMPKGIADHLEEAILVLMQWEG